MTAKGNKQGSHRQAPQQVRIIGGQWKRTPLPVANVDGLRPTPDRVRETVFNWINHQLGAGWNGIRCLDLFAGSGALGFEAASRGAAQVTLVEANPTACRNLDAIKTKLQAAQVQVTRDDALRFVKSAIASGQQFDLIFLDPPYQSDWLAQILPLCAVLLRDGGLLYTESAQALAAEDATESPKQGDRLHIIRADRAGMVHYYLLQR
ncbi:MAG: rRNA ((966)-N(2))-methyltransferase RsmD [Burkholderiaceae bacterium]|nr:rRNA ((966)-N(2))-methyltransferase RsmD [Burkholderiaceae bacterium]